MSGTLAHWDFNIYNMNNQIMLFCIAKQYITEDVSTRMLDCKLPCFTQWRNLLREVTMILSPNDNIVSCHVVKHGIFISQMENTRLSTAVRFTSDKRTLLDSNVLTTSLHKTVAIKRKEVHHCMRWPSTLLGELSHLLSNHVKLLLCLIKRVCFFFLLLAVTFF